MLSGLKNLKFDQHCAIVVLVLAVVYAYLGTHIDVSFYNGVFGPHHWIYFLGGMLILFSIWLMFEPSKFVAYSPTWLEVFKIIPFLTVIVLYILILPYIGFLITMTVLIFAVSIMFGAKKHYAAISAIVMTATCFILFDVVLQISLGRGLWFR